jgi:streptogramin lyase
MRKPFQHLDALNRAVGVFVHHLANFQTGPSFKFRKTFGGLLACVGLCSFFPVASYPATHLSSRALGGTAHGGYGVLVGSTVTLYAVSSAGYGSAATALGSTVTDASGNFSLTSYTCPSDNPMTYFTATGGISGTNTTANPMIRLILGTGPCSTIPGTIIINELSTVATVYALRSFTDVNTLSIGAPSTNAVGLANAFGLIDVLYNSTTGTSGTLFSRPGIPASVVEKFDSLADILVSCVNSASPFAACGSLFQAATPPGGALPTNTQQALLDIASNPSNDVSEIYALQSSVQAPVPFLPTLSAAPKTWLFGVYHGFATTVQPEELAVDESGNVYVADQGMSGASGGLIRLTPSGAVTEFTVDASAPFGVAVTSAGDIWVTNSLNGTLVEYNAAGAVVAGPVTGLTSPRTVVVDLTGNLWVANTGANSILEFSSSGVLLNTFRVGGLAVPFDVAVDGVGDVWSANEKANSISRISGGVVTSFSQNGLSTPMGIVADNEGHIWVGNSDATTRISEFTSTGAPINFYPNGGSGRVLRLASDGAANLWASDVDAHALTELSPDGTAISPDTGYVSLSLTKAPQSIAIDQSGNIWVSDLSNHEVAEFIGAAVPVKAPLIGPAKLP